VTAWNPIELNSPGKLEMIKTTIKKLLTHCGYKVVARDAIIEKPYRNLAKPLDYMESEFLEIWKDWCSAMKRNNFSPSFYTTYKAAKYLLANNIAGDFVESGVYEGAQCAFLSLALQRLGGADRMIYLYDTYEGMPQPTAKDLDLNKQEAAIEKFNRLQQGGVSEWNSCSLDQVRSNVLATGYDESKLRFVQGKVQDSLREVYPENIAFLRLDTDFYESTQAEMNVLFPRLASGGVFIVDGYGRWAGQQQAVDEHLAEHGIEPLLLRSGYNDWVAIKP
jgi:O-methyltransferase